MTRARANLMPSVVRDHPSLAAVIASAPVTDLTSATAGLKLRIMQDGADPNEDQAENALAALPAYFRGASLLEVRPRDPPDDDQDQPEKAMPEARNIWFPDPALRDERFRAGLEMILDAVPRKNSF